MNRCCLLGINACAHIECVSVHGSVEVGEGEVREIVQWVIIELR